ncbi:MAG TPA: L-threonine 3-dehydrogenase [Candidatus Dormibacteraeota bacterium]|nr:L-threonine 3-dehydrogenase [Candidatus Dormibacteraeota bacterium]
MKAVLKAQPGVGVKIADVPEPEAGTGEILVRVEATSICGSDLAIYDWRDWVAERMQTPRVIGHEFCGTVEAIGPGVETVMVGAFIAAETHIVDGTCHQCLVGDRHVCENVKLIGFDRDGCFAEYVTIPAENAWITHRSMPLEVASIQEPFGNAVHSATRGPLKDQVVLVTGCGPIGLFCIGIARAEGARRVIATDINAYRLGLAHKMGADALLDTSSGDAVDAIREAAGAPIDVVLEMSGHSAAITQALHALRPGGWISLLGLPVHPMTLDLNGLVIQKGVTVHGIFGRRIWETWEHTRRYLETGLVDVSPLITHRIGLDDVEEAMQLLEHGESGKVVMFPGGVPARSGA